MPFLAKLISLEAIDVVNAEDGDRCTLHPVGFSSDATFIARQGDKFFFEFFAQEELKNGFRFTDELEIALLTEDLNGRFPDGPLGVVTILPDESGRGEQKRQFEGVLPLGIPQGGDKFHYELTYSVFAAQRDQATSSAG